MVRQRDCLDEICHPSMLIVIGANVNVRCGRAVGNFASAGQYLDVTWRFAVLLLSGHKDTSIQHQLLCDCA